jgi:hypothetical protein
MENVVNFLLGGIIGLSITVITVFIYKLIVYHKLKKENLAKFEELKKEINDLKNN